MLTSVLEQGRAAAEARMIDGCVIVRPGPPGVWDEDTGVREPSVDLVVYTGKCEVQVSQEIPETPTAGEHRHLQSTLTVKVPVAVTTVQERDRVTVVAAVMDPALVGRSGVVTSVLRKTAATARRLIVEEVSG